MRGIDLRQEVVNLDNVRVIVGESDLSDECLQVSELQVLCGLIFQEGDLCERLLHIFFKYLIGLLLHRKLLLVNQSKSIMGSHGRVADHL